MRYFTGLLVLFVVFQAFNLAYHIELVGYVTYTWAWLSFTKRELQKKKAAQERSLFPHQNPRP